MSEVHDAVEAHAHPPSDLVVPDEGALHGVAALFRALADPGRLRTLLALGEGEVCVSELAEATGDGLPLTSQRLRVLRAENLVRRRRDGRHVYYALADHHVVELVRNALEHALEQGER
ncbi:MAG: metalloregulator ArsR/SmtB family transcription factor [Myxococcota bacterium]